MADMSEVLKDPDFYHPETTDEDRKVVLSAVDKKFKGMGQAEKDRTIKNMVETYQKNQKSQEQEKQARVQTVAPQAQQAGTKWEQMVAPVTQMVGRGVEVATEPLVGLARMQQGEGAGAAFGPETFSASHPQTANQVASGIVPQSPWQAGAMAGAMIPGMAAVGPLAKVLGPAGKLGGAVGRVGGAALGGGTLQGLLGSGGALEGGNNIAGEVAAGTAKGAGAQAGGEAFGKLLGMLGRHTPVLAKHIKEGPARQVQKTAGEIAPEFAGAGKTAAEMGTFYKGTQGSEKAAQAALTSKTSELESNLLATQGHPYIDTPGLRDSYKKVLAMAKAQDPTLWLELQTQLSPNKGYGFLPEQAVKILSLVRQNLNPQATGWGHIKQDAVNTLTQEIEGYIGRAGATVGQFTKARDAYGKAKGLEELMMGSFKPGQGKGYNLDLQALQEMMSGDNAKKLANRFSPDELKQLYLAATRNASSGPGLADKASGNLSVPTGTGWRAIVAATLRSLQRHGGRIGEKPGTLPQGVKGGLGVATSGAAGQRREED